MTDNGNVDLAPLAEHVEYIALRTCWRERHKLVLGLEGDVLSEIRKRVMAEVGTADEEVIGRAFARQATRARRLTVHLPSGAWAIPEGDEAYVEYRQLAGELEVGRRVYG